MPGAHGGYGLPNGGVAAIRLDMDAAVCPGVVFDINCGVRLIRTDLTREDVERKQARLADLLQTAVPASVGTVSPYTLTTEDIDGLLERGMDVLAENGYAWPEDVAVCETAGGSRARTRRS